MKRSVALLLSLLLVLCLFSGCSKSGAETKDPENSESSNLTEVPEPDYYFAAGNYETDEDGWPVGHYEYETPFCKTGETLTFWTINYIPETLPEEGLDGIDFCVEEQKRTGVDIEYICATMQNRNEQFQTLLAADDLADLMAGAISFYPGSPTQALEDGFFVNIYEYKDYCPNYMYLIKKYMENDINLYDNCFLDDTTMVKFQELDSRGGLISGTVGVRLDWIEELGMTIDDVITMDDYEDLAKWMKTEKGASYPIGTLTGDLDRQSFFGCYDTYTTLSIDGNPSYPKPYVKDGKVIFSYTNDDNAKAFVQRMNSWVSQELVNPDWMSPAMPPAEHTSEGLTGIAILPANMVENYNANNSDPNCRWGITKMVRLYDDQVLHLGAYRGHAGWGNTEINAKCENIPLAVTWCDWRYSEEGAFLGSYGIEGTTYVLDENGKPTATEFMYNNPDGQLFAFLKSTFAANFLSEHIHHLVDSNYMYPGGDITLQDIEYFYDIPYDGAYEWPQGIQLTTEQSQRFASYQDISTYMMENILLFVNGEKPMSEWDAYVNGLIEIGLLEAEAIYQEAYDAYIAKVAARNT